MNLNTLQTRHIETVYDVSLIVVSFGLFTLWMLGLIKLRADFIVNINFLLLILSILIRLVSRTSKHHLTPGSNIADDANSYVYRFVIANIHCIIIYIISLVLSFGILSMIKLDMLKIEPCSYAVLSFLLLIFYAVASLGLTGPTIHNGASSYRGPEENAPPPKPADVPGPPFSPVECKALEERLQKKYEAIIDIQGKWTGLFMTFVSIIGVVIAATTWFGLRQITLSKVVHESIKSSIAQMAKLDASLYGINSQISSLQFEVTKLETAIRDPQIISNTKDVNSLFFRDWISIGDFANRLKEVRFILTSLQKERVAKLKQSLFDGRIEHHIFNHRTTAICDFMQIIDTFLNKTELPYKSKIKKFKAMAANLQDVLANYPTLYEARYLLGYIYARLFDMKDSKYTPIAKEYFEEIEKQWEYFERSLAFSTRTALKLQIPFDAGPESLETQITDANRALFRDLKNLALYYTSYYKTHKPPDSSYCSPVQFLEKAEKYYKSGLLWNHEEDLQNESIYFNLSYLYYLIAESKYRKLTHSIDIHQDTSKLSLDVNSRNLKRDVINSLNSAIKLAKKALSLNQYYARAHNALAWCHIIGSDWDEKLGSDFWKYSRIAVYHADQAVKYAQFCNNYEYVSYLGSLSKSQAVYGNYNDAVNTINKAIDIIDIKNRSEDADRDKYNSYLSDYLERRKSILCTGRTYYEKIMNNNQSTHPDIYAMLGYFYNNIRKCALYHMELIKNNSTEKSKHEDMLKDLLRINHLKKTASGEIDIDKPLNELRFAAISYYVKAIVTQKNLVFDSDMIDTSFGQSFGIDPLLFARLASTISTDQRNDFLTPDYIDKNTEYNEHTLACLNPISADNQGVSCDSKRLPNILHYAHKLYYMAISQPSDREKILNNLSWLYSKAGTINLLKDPLGLPIQDHHGNQFHWIATHLGEKAAEMAGWNDFEHDVHTLAEAYLDSQDTQECRKAVQIIRYAIYRNEHDASFNRPYDLGGGKTSTPEEYLKDAEARCQGPYEETPAP